MFFLVAAATMGTAKEKWIYARTDHFEMYSCASERFSRELLNDLEQFRAGFRAVFPGSGEGGRVPVVIFGYDRQFRPYQPLYDGKERRVGGYFSYFGASAMIAVCAENWTNAHEIVYHEYVHYLVRESRRDPPLWLNEGLATAYQTTKVTRDSIELGLPNSNYLGFVRREKLMPLERLLNITASSPVYNEQNRASSFYANAWLLTHYLVFGSDSTNAAKLLHFLSLMERAGAGAAASFEEAFGKNFQQMEAALEEYASSGQCLVRIKKVEFPDLFEKIKFAPLDAVSRHVVLEKLRWQVRRPRKNSDKFGDPNLDSRYRLADLAESAPSSPKPHEALALIAAADDRREDALSHWQKAAELGSEDPYTYFALAKDPVHYLLDSPSLDYRMPELVADPLRRNLERAIELRPEYREAWECLAQIEAFAAQPRIAVINRLQTYVQTIEKKANLLAALAIIRWRFNDLATSHAILDSLEIEKGDDFARLTRSALWERMKRDAADQSALAENSLSDSGG